MARGRIATGRVLLLTAAWMVLGATAVQATPSATPEPTETGSSPAAAAQAGDDAVDPTDAAAVMPSVAVGDVPHVEVDDPEAGTVFERDDVAPETDASQVLTVGSARSLERAAAARPDREADLWLTVPEAPDLYTSRTRAQAMAGSTAADDEWLESTARSAAGTTVTADIVTGEDANVPGIAFAVELHALDSTAPDSAWTSFSADVSALASGVGADFSDRLTLMVFPECVLTSPANPDCLVGVPLTTVSTGDGDVVSAVVPVESADSGLTTAGPGASVPATLSASGPVGGGSVIAAVSGASGSTGTFTQTAPAPAGSFSVGEQSGSFNYTLPFEVPAASFGPTPSVDISYSSASVDSRTISTSSQPSWVGEGWDLSMPYIERLYKNCGEDGFASRSTELCWHSPYEGKATQAAYVMYFGGTMQELVWDAGDRYRLSEDDGTRITRKVGAGNGDDDGEYFYVQTPDGTTYKFGFGSVPGSSGSTNAVATVPVYGDDASEPRCGGTAVTNYCLQGYRWMLDGVVDPFGSGTSYYYTAVTNRYARGSAPNLSTEYTAALYPKEMRYGFVWGDDDASAEGRVYFFTKDRCGEATGSTYDALGGDAAACPTVNAANAASYPDVPVDLLCASTCTSAQNAPAFFLTKRLDSIRADVRVRNADTGTWAWQPKRRLQLQYLYPNTSDGSSAALWLESAQSVDYGSATTVNDDLIDYATNFDGVVLANRVDYGTNVRRLNHRRIAGIRTPTGGYIEVSYVTSGGRHCPTEGSSSDAFASWYSDVNENWDENTWDCHPLSFDPDGPGGTPAGWGIFHRYLVKSVANRDLVGGSPDQTTTYTYAGKPAWAYQDSILFDRGSGAQTWNSWRGYEKVSSTTGSGNATVTVLNQYYRGLDNDYRAGGTTISATIKPIVGDETPVVDDSHFQGQLLATRTTDVDRAYRTMRRVNLERSIKVNGPELHNAADSRIASTVDYTRVTDSSGAFVRYATTRSDYAYDTAGRTVAVETDADGLLGCVKTSYVDRVSYQSSTYYSFTDPAGWGKTYYLSRPNTVTTRDGSCTSDDITGHVDTYYDGSSDLNGQRPTSGAVTKEVAYTSHGGTLTSTATYDSHGRILSARTPGDQSASTASMTWTYERLDTATLHVSTTNALAQTTETWREATHGNITKVRDIAGNYTHLDYDAAGRLTDVYQPAQYNSSTLPPAGTVSTVTYGYGASAATQAIREAPIKIKTLPNYGSTELGDTNRSYTFYDGLGRERETHTATKSGTTGRVITATTYDDRGLPDRTTAPFYDSATGATWSAGMASVNSTSLPSYTYTTYDWAGRAVSTQLRTYGTVKRTTTTSYLGDRTRTIDPSGGITTTVYDGRGRVSDIYEGNADIAVSTNHSSYTYTTDKEGFTRAAITDPEGNVTSTITDRVGRQTELHDANAGTTTYTYDDAGNVTRVVTETGVVAMEYDRVGRMTGRTTAATVGGPALSTTAWTYDTADGVTANGQLLKTVESADSSSFVSQITVVDALERPITTRQTLPNIAGLGAFSGKSYDTTVHYDGRGRVDATVVPGVGGVAAETVSVGYDKYGLPWSLTGSTAGEVVTSVSHLADGRLASRSYAGGLTRTVGWDEATGAVTSLTAASSSLVVQDDRYGYDRAGRVTSVTDVVASTVECFTYDGLDRLAKAWTSAGSCGAGPGTGWDTGVGAYSQSWSYSPGGRITSVTSAAHEVESSVRTYAYDGSSPAAVTAVGGIGTFTYDAAGRVTSRTTTSTQTLGWDVLSRVTSLTDGSDVTRYLYDSAGQRYATLTGTSATLDFGAWQATDADTTDASAADISVTRVYALETTVATWSSTSGLSVVLDDRQGSATVTASVSTGGTITAQSNTYTPYGEHVGVDAIEWSKGWLGQDEDDTGLTYLNARYYDPVLARFISPDPILVPTDPTSLDPYTYAGNNPITYIDPTGLRPACASGGALDQDACYNGAPGDMLKGGANPEYNRGMNGPQRGCAYCAGVAQNSQPDEVDAIIISVYGGVYNYVGGMINGFTSVIPGFPAVEIWGDYETYRWSSYIGSGTSQLMMGGLGTILETVRLATGAARIGITALKASDEAVDVVRAAKTGTALVKYDADYAVGQLTAGGRATASQLDGFGAAQGWLRTQTATGPVKYIDGNGVVRLTIKQGSPRTPGSGLPHVELRNLNGVRIDPFGNAVSRTSPGNHTPIVWDW